MGARSKARKRALDLLFEAGQRDLDAVTLAGERMGKVTPPIPAYAVTIVEGVAAHRERIDELISTYLVGWTIDRIPAVDLQVLRIGAWELLWADDVPDAVAIDEAVELAKMLSTDDSPQYVNGLLSRLMQLKPAILD